MNEVEFHTGVADPLAYACRLLRKAYRSGARVLVTAPPATLALLDRALWTFEEREFVPHVRQPGAAEAVAARTPIWLAPRADLPAPPPLLVNLGADAADDLSPFERLIEIVGSDAEEADRGRNRWRAYKARGLGIVHHRSDAAAG